MAVVRAGDMHSVGQQEVMKAWESGYAVRWAQTASFLHYLTFQQHSIHGGSWPWWDRSWRTNAWPWYEHSTPTDTYKTESGMETRNGNVFPRVLGDTVQTGGPIEDQLRHNGTRANTTWDPPYYLIPKYYGPDCSLSESLCFV